MPYYNDLRTIAVHGVMEKNNDFFVLKRVDASALSIVCSRLSVIFTYRRAGWGVGKFQIFLRLSVDVTRVLLDGYIINLSRLTPIAARNSLIAQINVPRLF